MYKYSRKKAKKIHIVDPNTDKTYCKLENSNFGGKLTEQSDFIPRNRELCSVCVSAQKTWDTSTPSRAEFYRSWEWKKLRYDTLKYYGAVCMLCHATEDIVVDHIKPASKYPDLRLDPNNVQVLCGSCNRGKSNDDETDFRPKTPEPELTPDQMQHLKTIQ